MLQYEIFRQSMIGWAALGSYLLVASPSFQVESGSFQWLAAVLFGLALSPAFGYVVGQLNRVYYTLRKNRPNDTAVDTALLHREFGRVVTDQGSADPALLPLRNLPAKDLNRLLWVTYANKDLRDRSESYWERYYTNVCITIAAGIGAAAGLATFITKTMAGNATAGSDPADWAWICVKITLLVLVCWGLMQARKDYKRIACAIENAWIQAFLEKLSQEPLKFGGKLFNL